jgi:gp16 family phage-associated protein
MYVDFFVDKFHEREIISSERLKLTVINVIMNDMKRDGNDIKHLLGQKELNLKKFSELYGFKYRLVSDVVRGTNLGKYGKGREILEKLNEVLASDKPASDNTSQEATHEH